MKEDVKEKIKTVKEAIIDWESGKLDDLSALIAIHLILFPKKPSDDAKRWAMRVIEEREWLT
jgi:hypothetical protein